MNASFLQEGHIEACTIAPALSAHAKKTCNPILLNHGFPGLKDYTDQHLPMRPNNP
jgi:hypothetical protein